MNRAPRLLAQVSLGIIAVLCLPTLAFVYTPSSGSVSDAGAVSYSIPIQVPPGTAGMAPKLSISYNSLGSNGPAGVGWSLAGLSAISRCPQTLATDSAVGAVRLDANDRLCLDGSRLVTFQKYISPTYSVSSGVYGADGTEYRTEVEALKKIISHGTAGAGPAWFQVWTSDGLTYEYGNTPDSQVLAKGSTSVRTWAVNKVTDLFGNYYTFTYGQDPTTGSYQPTRIDYTGNAAAGLSPYNSVQFSYEARTDNEPFYVGSSLVTLPNRLTHIKTYADATLVRDYRIAYETSPRSGRSRAISVTECAGDGTCMPQLTMGYVASPGGISAPGSSPTTVPGLLWYETLNSVAAGDFNGDGIQDVAYLVTTSAPAVKVCYGPSFTSCAYASIPSGWTVVGFGDFNGDGISDIAVQQPNGTLWLCAGPGLSCGSPVTYGTLPGLVYTVGDFDGDGIMDLLGVDPNTWSGILCRFKYGQYACGGIGNTFIKSMRTITGDFDGDGTTEILFVGSTGYSIGNFSGVTYPGVQLGMNMSGVSVLVGDFNGDGKSDLLLLTSTGVQFCAGPGLMTTNNCVQVPGTSGDWFTPYKAVVGDFDGDGKSDILLTGASGTRFCSGPAFIASGTCTAVNSNDWRTAMLQPGDFNGDGTSDLLVVASGSSIQLAAGATHLPDLVGSVTNTAFNTATTFAYRPLTDTTVHAPGTGSVYPNTYTSQPFLDPVHQRRPFYVAQQMGVPNGVGGTNLTTYKYEKAANEIDGRGFSGFRVTHATDVARNRERVKTLSQTFPYGFQVEQIQTFASGTLAQKWVQTFGNTTTCDYRTVAKPISIVDASYGLDGVWRSEYRTYSGFDCFANATNVTAYQSENSSVAKQVKSLQYFGQWGNATWGTSSLLTSSVVTSYDGNGQNPVTQTDSYSYQANTNFMTEHIVEPGDANLRLVTDYTPDAFGNTITTAISGSDIDTRTTTSTYDSRGRFRLSTTNPLGQVASQTYDSRFGFVTSNTDLNGLATTRTPDVFGRAQQEIRPDTSQTTWTYSICCSGYAMNPNLAYQVTTTSSGSSQPGTVYYDSRDRKVLSVRRNFPDTDWIDEGNTIYNAAGQVATAYLPYERIATNKPYTSTTYDTFGRKATKTAPDGGVTSYSYTIVSVGNAYQFAETNPRGNTTSRNINARDNLLVSINLPGVPGAASYHYNALDQVSNVADSANVTSTFTYDHRGRMTAKMDADLGSWTYTYDRLGQLKTQTDAKGQVTTFAYDKLGRPLSRAEPSQTGTWTWDTALKGVGKLTSTSTNAGVTRTYTYDSLGRPASQTLTVDGTASGMSFAYDSIGRPFTLTYPTGFFVKYAYSATGYLSEIDNGSTNAMIWRAVDMDPAGLSNEDLGNGTGVVTIRNPVTQRVSQIGATRDSDGSVLQNHTYTYDLNGNVATRGETTQGLSETLAYDSLDRITSVAGPAPKTFAYDATGNITNKSDVGAYTYQASGHEHAVSTAGGVSYTYDANGNMLTSGPKSISWTSFNMPASVHNGSASYSWAYEATLGRVKYVAPSATTYYFELNGSDVFDRIVHPSLTENKHYIFAAGRPVAEYISRSDGGSDMHYLVSDRLGSISLVLDGSATPAERLSYDVHGKRRFAGGTDDSGNTLAGIATNDGFTDHEHLDDLGLIHMKGRVYDPRVGRFISPDPMPASVGNPQSLNIYTYALNNPLGLIDPSGFCNVTMEARGKSVALKSACLAPAPQIVAGPPGGEPEPPPEYVPVPYWQAPDIPSLPDDPSTTSTSTNTSGSFLWNSVAGPAFIMSPEGSPQPYLGGQDANGPEFPAWFAGVTASACAATLCVSASLATNGNIWYYVPAGALPTQPALSLMFNFLPGATEQWESNNLYGGPGFGATRTGAGLTVGTSGEIPHPISGIHSIDIGGTWPPVPGWSYNQGIGMPIRCVTPNPDTGSC